MKLLDDLKTIPTLDEARKRILAMEKASSHSTHKTPEGEVINITEIY